VFVQKGTHVGSFLPNVTQYIELDGTHQDLIQKWPLINQLFFHAKTLAVQARQKTKQKEFGNFLTFGLAALGFAKVVEIVNE
jgi:hypothetical protein